MNNKIILMNLIDMLRELDTEKNDSKAIKETLEFIAERLEDLIELIND